MSEAIIDLQALPWNASLTEFEHLGQIWRQHRLNAVVLASWTAPDPSPLGPVILARRTKPDPRSW